VVLEGPAVTELASAFAEVWATTGAPIPQDAFTSSDTAPSRGGVALRVIATAPATASVFRLDLMIASLAQKTLWLTDAYFVGVPAYVQALCDAAKDGVDVRLLVPGGSDVPLVSPLSRSGYRPLLEAGVRVFEWKGSMLHAKTAVVDSQWARVGSTNLNFQSWLGNYELDVAVEDVGFAQAMEVMYGEDLANATEIVLSRRARIQPVTQAERRRWRLMQERGSGRAAAGALRLANSVGAAITSRRELGPAESRLMAAIGVTLGLVSVLTFIWPRLVAIPLAIVLAWLALGSLARARRLRLRPPSGTPAVTAIRGATEFAPDRLPDQPAPDLLR
jgi:cardiolipin synthase